MSGFIFQQDPSNVFFRCVEDSTEAMMITDWRGDLLYVNPAWERIYGYCKSEAIGRNPRIVQSGRHTPEFYEEMWTALMDPKRGHWKGEVVNRTKDGELVDVFLAITAFRNGRGTVRGFMGIAVDMRGQKQIESQVLRQERLACVGLLSGGLAQEIGTPLGVIRGRAELLKSHVASDEAAGRHVDAIIGQIDRVSDMIGSLVNVTREPPGHRIGTVSLRDEADKALGVLRRRAERARISLENTLDPGLSVIADTERLGQILLNLSFNAVQAVEKRIADQPGGETRHFIRVSGRRTEDGFAHIEFRDSGCGIPPHHIEEIFKPFFTTNKTGDGTGLGLAVADKLINDLRGTIEVRSVPGEGTTFDIRLPADPKAGTAAEPIEECQDASVHAGAQR